MQFVKSWVTNDLTKLVSFAEATLIKCMKYIQYKRADKEAGGIFLGSVHGPYMLIEQATEPTILD